MKPRRCTHCQREFKGDRKTCSRACQRQRYRVGGAAGRVTQAERGTYWTPRGTGAARSVMIDGRLQVLDPVALAAAGYELVDAYGKPWRPL